MEWRLVLREHLCARDGRPRQIMLSDGLTLGREGDAVLKSTRFLPDVISRLHATITASPDDAYTIENVGRNLTLVNQRKLKVGDSTVLCEHDVVVFCPTCPGACEFEYVVLRRPLNDEEAPQRASKRERVPNAESEQRDETSTSNTNTEAPSDDAAADGRPSAALTPTKQQKRDTIDIDAFFAAHTYSGPEHRNGPGIGALPFSGGRSPSRQHAVAPSPQPRAISNKEDQAFMYPGYVIQRAPDIWINNKKYLDPVALERGKEKPRMKKESKFFITINPNQRVYSDPRARAACKKAFDTLAQREALRQYITFGPCDPAGHFKSDVFDDVIIEEQGEFNYNLEVGAKQHRLHGHAMLTVHHYSQIQLDARAIMRLFRNAYNSALQDCVAFKIHGNPYVSIELMKQANYAQIMAQYMFKDDPSRCPS